MRTRSDPFLDKGPLLQHARAIDLSACDALLDPGTRVFLGENVKFLYHRWQHEAFPPSDFLQACS